MALLMMAACNSPTTPNTPHRSTMSAKIDGIRWDAVDIFAENFTDNRPPSPTFAVTGTDAQNINLIMNSVPTVAGTYALGPYISSGPQPPQAFFSAGDGVSFTTFGPPPSGSITVAAVTATSASGTFSFTAVSQQPGSKRVVTEGTFDVTFCHTDARLGHC